MEGWYCGDGNSTVVLQKNVPELSKITLFSKILSVGINWNDRNGRVVPFLNAIPRKSLHHVFLYISFISQSWKKRNFNIFSHNLRYTENLMARLLSMNNDLPPFLVLSFRQEEELHSLPLWKQPWRIQKFLIVDVYSAKPKTPNI